MEKEKKEKTSEVKVEKTKKELSNEVKEKSELEEKLKIENNTLVLKNTTGKVVKEEDYFFGGKALPTFNKICGYPVDREDLLEIFNDIFNPELNFLFYKAINKEVYIIIIPIINSPLISKSNESIKGDFHKHAISFVGEGSVNLDTLKLKLKKIEPFIKNINK